MPARDAPFFFVFQFRNYHNGKIRSPGLNEFLQFLLIFRITSYQSKIFLIILSL